MRPPRTKLLDNGATVVVQEMRSAPVVAVQAWVGVGSADETPAEAGLAHVHEHMLFKGTERRRVGEIAQAIEGAGGEINAWTSFDQTVYHVVLASRDFNVGLDVLADAIHHSAFDAEELAREKEVVLEEIKRGEDQPSRVVTQALFDLAYRKHPYRNPVIGTRERVASFTRADVLAFFRKWYVPSNVTVVVVGDVSEEEAFAAVEGSFGAAPMKELPGRHGVVEPAQRAPRAVVKHEKIEEAYFNVAVHIPSVHHEDVPALDLLASVLGQGESTRLLQRVKRQRALVNDIYAYAYTPIASGLFTVGGTAAARKTERALGAAVRETFRLLHEPVSPAELGKARAVIESQAIFDRETAQGMARKLGFYQCVFGDLGAEQRYYDAVAKVTPETILEVARRYLSPEKLNVALVLPEANKAAQLDEAACLQLVTSAAEGERRRVRAPAPKAARPKSIKAAGLPVRRIDLPTGGVLLALQDSRVPLVALRAVWSGGLRLETPKVNGIGNFIAEVLTQGTRRRGAEEIAHEIDGMAASLGAFAGRNSFGLRAELLARHFERGLDLFMECLCEPAFAGDEVERQRQLILEEIRTQDDNPSGVAFRLFAEALYPRHPYRLSGVGTAQSVGRLSASALRRFYERGYDPGQAVYAMVGDVDPDRAAQVLIDRLGTTPPAGRPISGPQPDAALTEPKLVERVLDKKQAHIVLGFRGTTVRADDRFPLELLSTILSGQGGRLFLELRDKKSLAYSVSSFSVEGLEPGYFAVYIGTSPEKIEEAVHGIFHELRKVREQPVSAVELQRAQRYLVGTNSISLQRLAARSALIAFDECYELEGDASERYAERILAVRREDVMRVAQRYLNPRRFALSLVRPEDAVGVSALDPEAFARGHRLAAAAE